MASIIPRDVDVLIVGAGPTGLTLAVSLLSQGCEISIVDDHAEGENTSRAAVVYPGTLEELAPFGVADQLVRKGIRTPRFTIRDRDRILTPVPFNDLPTAFPYALLVSQAVTEAVLLERVKELGGSVRRPLTMTKLEQDASGVTVTFADGSRTRALIVIGADGAHSTTRKQAGIDISARSASASYSLADVHLTGGVPDDELIVYFSPAGHLVVLPLPGGVHRIVAHVEEAPERPDIPFLQQILDARGPEAERAVIHDIVWGSRFLTGHAIASRYDAGWIALAGDAAHTHSPLGGQGMNLGINDAIALGRLLPGILEDNLPDRLEAYNAVQRPIAKQVISVTDLLTNVATLRGPLRRLRNIVLYVLSPFIRRRLSWRLSLLYLRRAS
jgi:2-polyprenyl-6-methoxyphenol hydroxylase-like FAD-dependent oxidoreductase